jgi:hypothetical protein
MGEILLERDGRPSAKFHCNKVLLRTSVRSGPRYHVELGR